MDISTCHERKSTAGIESLSDSRRESACAESPSFKRRQRLPLPDDTLISPRLFPSFKSSPSLKLQSHRIADVSRNSAISLQSLESSACDRHAAAAAAGLPVQLLQHGRRSSLESVTGPSPTPNSTYQEQTNKVPQVSDGVLSEVPSVAAKSRPTTSGTRPSTSGGVAISLPSAPILDTFEPVISAPERDASIPSNASLNPAHDHAATKRAPQEAKSSSSAVPYVPPLDMSSISRFKYEHVQKQSSVRSDRSRGHMSVRTLDLPVSSDPLLPSARGYSGRKLVSGTPLSKLFAKERPKDTGKHMMSLVCSSLSVKTPCPPSHPPPATAAFSARWLTSHDYVNDIDSTSARIYQEFETRYRI
jgi:hypothetical protein